MAFEYIEEWLGCLDETTSYALWQSAAFCAANFVPWVEYGLIQDAFNPEGLPEYQVLVDAFTQIYGFTFMVIEYMEAPTPVWMPNDPVQWLASIPIILPFAPNLFGAPCTQQIFP